MSLNLTPVPASVLRESARQPVDSVHDATGILKTDAQGRTRRGSDARPRAQIVRPPAPISPPTCGQTPPRKTFRKENHSIATSFEPSTRPAP